MIQILFIIDFLENICVLTMSEEESKSKKKGKQ